MEAADSGSTSSEAIFISLTKSGIGLVKKCLRTKECNGKQNRENADFSRKQDASDSRMQHRSDEQMI